MSMNENQIYRILNWEMNESNKGQWINFLEGIFGQGNVSFDNLSCTIRINNNINNTIEITFPGSTGNVEIKFKNDSGTYPFGSLLDYGYYRGNNLFLKAETGGGLISRTLSNPKDELQYITVNNRYLIFTKVKDLKNNNVEYDCCIYEKDLDNSDRAVLQIAVFPPNNEDANLINSFSFILSGPTNLVSIAPYPVLSQTTLRFDTYVFPYLFKKETYPECAFGIKKIQGRRYFLTKYLALQLEDEEGGN